MSRPKFSELTNLQVADLIATKIMGYEIREFDHEHEVYTVYFSGGAYQNSRLLNPLYSWNIFNPVNSLDDCWRAEEKMPTIAFGLYSNALFDMFDTGAMVTTGADCGKLIHATAPQKCEAMLRAIGEIE